MVAKKHNKEREQRGEQIYDHFSATITIDEENWLQSFSILRQEDFDTERDNQRNDRAHLRSGVGDICGGDTFAAYFDEHLQLCLENDVYDDSSYDADRDIV